MAFFFVSNCLNMLLDNSIVTTNWLMNTFNSSLVFEVILFSKVFHYRLSQSLKCINTAISEKIPADIFHYQTEIIH